MRHSYVEPRIYVRADRTRRNSYWALLVTLVAMLMGIDTLRTSPLFAVPWILFPGVVLFIVLQWVNHQLPVKAVLQGKLLALYYLRRPTVCLDLWQAECLMLRLVREGRSARWYYSVKMLDGSSHDLFDRGTFPDQEQLVQHISYVSDLPWNHYRWKVWEKTD